MKLLLPGLFSFLLFPAALCAHSQPSAAADQPAVVSGNNAFAVALYGQLRAQPGNLFFSPESISTALAMTYAGASGDTAAEMAKTLHFTLPPERLHPAMGALLSDLNAQHNGYQLSVADALWAEKDFNFLDSFLKLTSSNYGAGFNPVDFKNAPDAARLTINQWVDNKTDNKITYLLQPGSVGPLTRMVLTNAIYFKADWERPFNIDATEDEDFHLSATQTVKAPMMNRTGEFNYFSGGSFQELEIPYKSGDLSMIIFLPSKIGGLPALEQSLTAANAQKWLTQLQPVPKVILSMPKFKMTQQFGLADTLSAMGMPQAFQEKLADFSGMTGKRDLWISAVVHKAYIDVDELGTVAAGATAIEMVAMSRQTQEPPPVVFKADRPFLLLIRDNRSGSILFMGRVADPTK